MRLLTWTLLVVTFAAPVFSQEIEKRDVQEHKTGDPYPNPGITGYREGEWLGADHLLNVSSEIGVEVEVMAPKEAEVPLDAEQIEGVVRGVFRDGGLIPDVGGAEGAAPLPFFHVLLMVAPIGDGFFIFCEGRLFEEVSMKRVKLDAGTYFQAVTWENQNLFYATQDNLQETVDKMVREITQLFVDRFQFYQEEFKKRR